jgi:hypothetical protein
LCHSYKRPISANFLRASPLDTLFMLYSQLL